MKQRIISMIWNIRIQKQPAKEQEGKGIQKNKDSVSRLWDNFKQSNIHFIGVPEGEEIGNLFEKNNERKILYNLKEIDMEIQEAESQARWPQRSPPQDT